MKPQGESPPSFPQGTVAPGGAGTCRKGAGIARYSFEAAAAVNAGGTTSAPSSCGGGGVLCVRRKT
jgi:hypothetical protein